MKEAGFVDIQVFEYYWPFGGQSEDSIEKREFSQYLTTGTVTMLHHMIYRTMADSPISEGRKQKIDQMRSDMRWSMLPEMGKHQKFYVTIGQKPE